MNRDWCLHGIKTSHEGLGLCHTCYCQNIQKPTEKDYETFLQVGDGLTAFRPGQKMTIEKFAGGQSLVIGKKTSFVKSLVCVMPVLIRKTHSS